METKAPMKKNQTLIDIMKGSSSSSSESLSPLESPHSPLHSVQGDLDPPDPKNTSSPHVSPEATSPGKPPVDNSKALITVDNLSQLNSDSLSSPSPLHPPTTPPQQPSHLTVNQFMREQGRPTMTTKMKMNGGGGGGGGEKAVAVVLRRSKAREALKMAALGFRLSEIILCLISFSVISVDKTQGWSADSFDRYKEYMFF